MVLRILYTCTTLNEKWQICIAVLSYVTVCVIIISMSLIVKDGYH